MVTRFTSIVLGVAVSVAVAAGAASAFAAMDTVELYYRTTAAAFAPGSDLVVGVFVNADEPVNAFDVEIGYSPATLEFVSFDTSDSIVDVWRGTPQVLSDGIIRIQGGLRSPFSGRAGELTKLTFRVRPEAAGTLQWSFRNASVYAADGTGMIVPSSATPLIVPIVASIPAARLAPLADATAPVFSALRIAESPVDGAYFAVWEAHDEGSGIVNARIRGKQWFVWGPWETAVNPVRLQRGTWAVEVRVTDGQGNSADARAYLWPTFTGKATGAALTIGVLAFVLVVGRRVKRRR
jgi:hypothetical protein